MVCPPRIAGLGDEPRDTRKPSTSLRGRRSATTSGSTVRQDDRNLLGSLGLRNFCDLALCSHGIERPSEIAPLDVDWRCASCTVAAEQRPQIAPRMESESRNSSRRPSGDPMCTLTVVTRNDTYLIGMNRDEKVARGAGIPPKIPEFDATRAIYPNDGHGGTWIGTNNFGITLALLNWNAVTPRGRFVKTRSRGRAIPALIDARSLSDLHAVFDVSNFEGMLPFRLIGVFLSEREIWEWRWDSRHIEFQVHEWKTRHWFSSSLSDDRAETVRGLACRAAQHDSDFGSVPWLRRLHGSHGSGPGPFSLCVHRENVKTLSYSEVMVTPAHVQMNHFRGSPCDMVAVDAKEIAGNGSAPSTGSGGIDPQALFCSHVLSAEQDDQPARYDERPADINRSRRKSVEEDEIGNLKYDEQRRDIHPRNAREFNGRQVERGAIKREKERACEKESGPCPQGRMMQSNSNDGIAGRFKNGSGKNEQKNFHV